MDKPFLLYDHRGGWFTKTATLSSEISAAARFTEFEASAMCSARVLDGRLQLIPVREADVKAVLGDGKTIQR